VNKLEDEYRDLFGAMKTGQPEALGGLLTALQPQIERSVKIHAGRSDPVLLGRARRMVVDSIDRYDPSMASLRTFTHNQLRGMTRYSAKQSQLVKVPERVAIERQRLSGIENELKAELARHPTDHELSERAGIPIDRLQYVRTFNPTLASSSVIRDDLGGEGPVASDRQATKDKASAYQSMVYSELDPYHQSIMEHTLGLHGRKPINNQALAEKLGRSPGAISQAKSRIQQRLDSMDQFEGLL